MEQRVDRKLRIERLQRVKSREDISYNSKILAQKTSECFSEIYKSVEENVNQGLSVEVAMSTVLNNAELTNKYPQLKDEKVQRAIKNLIRDKLYRKKKKQASEAEKEDVK